MSSDGSDSDTTGLTSKLETRIEDVSALVSENFLMFLVSVSLLFSLSANIILISDQNSGIVTEEVISPKVAGQMTVDFANTNILQPSPNNVSAELVSVNPANSKGLTNFYEVTVNVTNPSGSQETVLYTRKDGSLVFLQLPRYLDDQRFDPNKYH